MAPRRTPSEYSLPGLMASVRPIRASLRASAAATPSMNSTDRCAVTAKVELIDLPVMNRTPPPRSP